MKRDVPEFHVIASRIDFDADLGEWREAFCRDPLRNKRVNDCIGFTTGALLL
jgi:hypothetical protein